MKEITEAYYHDLGNGMFHVDRIKNEDWTKTGPWDRPTLEFRGKVVLQIFERIREDGRGYEHWMEEDSLLSEDQIDQIHKLGIEQKEKKAADIKRIQRTLESDLKKESFFTTPKT